MSNNHINNNDDYGNSPTHLLPSTGSSSTATGSTATAVDAVNAVVASIADTNVATDTLNLTHNPNLQQPLPPAGQALATVVPVHPIIPVGTVAATATASPSVTTTPNAGGQGGPSQPPLVLESINSRGGVGSDGSHHDCNSNNDYVNGSNRTDGTVLGNLNANVHQPQPSQSALPAVPAQLQATQASAVSDSVVQGNFDAHSNSRQDREQQQQPIASSAKTPIPVPIPTPIPLPIAIPRPTTTTATSVAMQHNKHLTSMAAPRIPTLPAMPPMPQFHPNTNPPAYQNNNNGATATIGGSSSTAQQLPPPWVVPVPNPLLQAPVPQQVAASVAQPQPSTQAQQPRPKIVLSPEARQALAKAIWSAIRSPTGDVDPTAMDEAVKAGLPKHAILNAARVARDREALKRKGLTTNPPTTTTATVPATASATTATTTTPQQLKVQSLQPPPLKAVSVAVPPPPKLKTASTADPTAVSSSRSTPTVLNVQGKPVSKQPTSSTSSTAPSTSATTSSSSRPTNALQQLKIEERNNWKRVHSGIFVVQKGRYMGLPHSMPCIVRAPTLTTATTMILQKPTTLPQRIPRSSLEVLKMIQLQERQRRSSEPTKLALLNPETMKRVKMEPKRISKALERSMKKARQSTQEALLKKLKDLNKSILAHSSDFYKYHKSIKSEASKLAKTVRDRLSKQSTSEKKKDESAERARLAALKANDMEAYKSLLEDTKNERLQYLWKKTDECLDQISSLLQQRNDHDVNSNNKNGSSSAAAASSYYAAAHLREEEVRQPNILAGGELKEYQLAGLQWMVSLYNNKLNGILADEMGLGKTIQAISLIAYLMEIKENLGPYLVIVPLSTLSNWVNEFAKWCPTCRVIVYKGTPTQRRDLYKNDVRNGQFNVLLTTYEYIIKDKGSLKKIIWQYAIVDEGHRMKNAQSKFAVTLGTVYTTRNRILLTGTPLQNNLPELWALLNFLLPAIFNSVESFDQWFNRPFATFSNKETEEQQDQMLSNEERMLIIHRLHELLRPFMLRRVKSEVLDQLPEKVEKVLRCELSSWQKELYKQISHKAAVDNKLDSFMDQQNNNNSRGLNNVVMQLRKVCNHPYLFSSQGYMLNDDLIRCSGKFQLLDDMLPKLKAAGHRILMFTQMTAVMTILEDYFKYRGYTSLRLDGSTPADERERRMYKFNAPDSPHFIFLLSTRAGGLGLNLATADVVIIFDSDWNPMMDLQAQDRAHRIGQRSDVSVFRLITYSPVEEKILARANEKLNMSELVVEAGKFNQDSVENDNSLERKKMMEVLLTDFESNANKNQEKLDRTSEDGDDDDDDKDSTSNSNDINELLSNNEQDYQVYTEIDDRRAAAPCPALYTDPNDLPDWIKYPLGSKEASEFVAFDPDVGRKRTAVAYDDGLTEKQFLRLMENQAQNDEANARKRKVGKILLKQDASSAAADAGGGGSAAEPTRPPGTMTEWTFRKLINTCKSVIALKDPATKRRLSEIFLEKPDPNVYPDYYTVIEKPIAINDILRKCRGHLYASVSEYWDDWKVLVANAKKFNGEGSWVANDSDSLFRELERVMKKNGLEEQPPPPKQRKKLRIKLSLKELTPEDEWGGSEVAIPPPTKKRRKSDM